VFPCHDDDHFSRKGKEKWEKERKGKRREEGLVSTRKPSKREAGKGKGKETKQAADDWLPLDPPRWGRGRFFVVTRCLEGKTQDSL
jgi:hypothetical protein